MTKPLQRIYILSCSGKVKLYWNRILQAWMDNVNHASPFGIDEVENRQLPYAARYEAMEDQSI